MGVFKITMAVLSGVDGLSDDCDDNETKDGSGCCNNGLESRYTSVMVAPSEPSVCNNVILKNAEGLLKDERDWTSSKCRFGPKLRPWHEKVLPVNPLKAKINSTATQK